MYVACAVAMYIWFECDTYYKIELTHKYLTTTMMRNRAQCAKLYDM